MYHAPNEPRCSHYVSGESNQRLLWVWTYVSGLVGGCANAKELSAQIARMHDHKGQLVIATWKLLSPYHEGIFRHAWQVVGLEHPDNAEFVHVDSDEWASYWNSRRFDSNWRPRPHIKS